MLIDVSRNRDSSWCKVINRIDEDESTLAFPFALNWLYPNKTISYQETILCSNNESVDSWNTIVQSLNRESTIHTLYSKDSFEEVDDPNGYLRKMLTEHYLNQFHKNGIPHHELKLKLGDVCLVMHAINGLGLANNSRVRVVSISNYSVGVIKFDNVDARQVIQIPRITFKFRMSFGQSHIN
jgi:hypothetical protein